MKDLFKNKTFGFYIGLLGGIVGVVAAIYYVIYSTSVGHFNLEVFATLALGVLGSVVAVLTKSKFAPLLPVLFFSLAFGLYINDRVLMFEEMINGIYGMNERGAILSEVIKIFVLNFISIFASIIATFSSREKA